jgi:hypothetical protein|tara:strand:- start:601 stop:855 length:255 start_codon:yes stop_codon:yes gene_type:complete
MTIGKTMSFATLPRDRVVTICQSSDKADVFEVILKQHPQIARERLIEQMIDKGIDDTQRILKDMDDYIEIHNEGLSSAIGILGL